ncbi:hypothetical protein FACS189429_1970 [Bacteroidia bacterium]|nr:hypothetical protein FACS189429_1970 [Bacteroidia bacterium]
MAKTIGRREFLKKSVLSIGSIVLASSLRAVENATHLSSKILSDQNPVPVSYPDLMPQYRQAKEFFYQKQYADASALFAQLIENNPTALFLYDGQARVYGAQQNLRAAAELWQQGVAANPDNAFFLHRYGICLRNLCLGNAAAAQQFATHNGIGNLYEMAAEKLVAANALNPKSIFQFDLKDFPRLLQKYNANTRNNAQPLILSDSILSQINTATYSVSTKWTNTRASRKPAIPPEDDNTVENSGNNRNNGNRNGNNGNGNGHANRHHRRNLHTDNERNEREKSEKKSKKRVAYAYLRNNAHNNNIQKVEKWGMQILADDINDTNSIGFLRQYYKKRSHSDRIISLNRYFYNNNSNIYSALALAASLVKYHSNTPSINEAKQLLATAAQYPGNLTTVGKGAYYNTLAKIREKENSRTQARAVLLEGIEMLNGEGGVAYSLMEHYAATFDKNSAAKAIAIQKALCNKTVAQISDQIWTWLEKYRHYLNSNEINTTEKIKALTALAKLQKTFKDSGYNATINEINMLRNSN